MERNNRLPNVIFLSSKVLEIIESQITEDVICLENEANGISAKNVSLCDEEVNETAEYRNIV